MLSTRPVQMVRRVRRRSASISSCLLLWVRPPPPFETLADIPQSILTGYQCLALATGLLGRWRFYYPPLATLVRLLALQGICWPATQLTLTVLGHAARPVITWAAIGTTTCMSRSVRCGSRATSGGSAMRARTQVAPRRPQRTSASRVAAVGHRRRVGWAAVGLARGRCAVRAPCGDRIRRDGVGQSSCVASGSSLHARGSADQTYTTHRWS